MDAGYGVNPDLRREITALGSHYAAGVSPNATVWTAGTKAVPPKPYNGCGRRAVAPQRDDAHHPVAIDQLALALQAACWQSIAWREGTKTELSSCFARVRVRAAHDLKIALADRA